MLQEMSSLKSQLKDERDRIQHAEVVRSHMLPSVNYLTFLPQRVSRKKFIENKRALCQNFDHTLLDTSRKCGMPRYGFFNVFTICSCGM